MAGKSKKSAGADVLAKRAELEAFCKDELKMGRHFGTIHRKTCRTPDAQEWTPCASCGSKPSLYQPGAERICEFRGVLIGDPVLDREIVEVAGGTNWVAFRIPLTFRDDNTVLGYGIGAYKHADPNIMVKKAKKNALIDGTRTGFALSDLFDDADHDDPSAEQLQSSADARPAPRAPRAAAPPRSSAQPLADQPDLGATHPANVQDGPAPPAREATEASTPSPKWWEIRAEFPTARWTVCDREDKEYTIMGVIHFPADARPMSGGGARKWSPFEPNSQGKDETNHFNDPFHHLLADRYACVFNGSVLPIAEHAAAMDFMAWGLVKKNGGAVPEWVEKALAEHGARRQEQPVAAPADEPSVDLDQGF
jgi:hypothetical protein